MANLWLDRSGNLSDSNMWHLQGTPANASVNGSYPTNTTLTYQWQNASITIPNGEVIDAVILFGRQINTTGTVTVGLSADNGSTAAQEVTVNVTDITYLASNTYGSWIVFKLPATVTGDGTAKYRVGFKASSAGNAAFYKSASTAGLFSYMLRQSAATSNATTGDNLYISGYSDGSGATVNTLTWTDTANTQFAGMTIANGGKLQVPTTASTAFTMKLAGMMYVEAGGEFRVGTDATTPLPSTSSFTLAFVNATNADRGIDCYGDFYCYGSPKTPWALLNANAAAGATSISLDTSPTGWSSNDALAIASTSRVYSECEQGQVDTVSSSTIGIKSFPGTAGALQYDHLGDTVNTMQAEVMNLTRNIVIKGTSISLQMYALFASGYTFNLVLRYVEFQYVGSNSTNKRGVTLSNTGTATWELTGCVSHDFGVNGSVGLYATNGAWNNINITDHISYNINSYGMVTDATSGTNYTIDNILIAKVTAASSTGINILDTGGTWSNIRVVGINGTSINIGEFPTSISFISNVTVHSGVTGITIAPQSAHATFIWDFTEFWVWRISGDALYYTSITASLLGLRVTNLNCKGCGSLFRMTQSLGYLEITNSANTGEASLPINYGMRFTTNTQISRVWVENVDFGVDTSLYGANPPISGTTPGDVYLESGVLANIEMRDVKIHAGYSVYAATPIGVYMNVKVDGYDATVHSTSTERGKYRYDTVTYNSDTINAYTNTFGMGNRSSSITITSAASTFQGNNTSGLVDGSTSNTSAYTNSISVVDKWIKFDFGSGIQVVVKECRWIQSAATAVGTWKWQGSNDDSSWTDIGSTFTLGGATTQYHTELNGNTTAYRYYRIYGTAGTTSTTTYVQEVEFKIHQAPNTLGGIQDAPTQKVEPWSFNTGKCESAPIYAFVSSGVTKTISVYVRKNDGLCDGDLPYSGAQPRLVVKRNRSIGITDDVVLDTATESNGVWELLTGTTPSVTAKGVIEAIVDCDGTTGFINVVGA